MAAPHPYPSENDHKPEENKMLRTGGEHRAAEKRT